MTSSSVSDQNFFSTTTPTPTTTTPPPITTTATPSLLHFLRLEVTRGYALELEEERFQARRDKVYMFLVVPREMERLMGYGFFQCMDAFLYLLTFLPLRVAHSIFRRTLSLITTQRSNNSSRWSGAEVCDGLKLLVLVVVVYLFLFIDTSVLYHLVKSQSVIKLYIFFNMLEVGDRLFASFVQDTIDALFLTATENNSSSSSSKSPRRQMSVTSHLLLVIFAVFGHALVILLQGTTLSVAINASNRALLTVMMSNNFVELKGAVFKKFDKINLFQVSCSDVRERFHLVVLLLVVCLQTMREYSWEESRFWVLFPDCLMVLLAEVGVDWVKHCFITRFNELDAEVYREYTLSLAYDLAQTKQRGRAFSDHSDMVGRRLGFVPLPLAVVLIRILRPCFPSPLTAPATIILTVLAFAALASFRTVSSILLLGKACDLIDHHHNSSSTTIVQQNVVSTAVSSPSHHHAAAAAHVKDEPIITPPPPSSETPPPPDLPSFSAVVPKTEEDVLSELLRRRKTAPQSSSSVKYSRSMSATLSPRSNYATYSGCSSSSARDLMKEKKFSGTSTNNDDWDLLESFGRLLPANSAVSVLSVQFNEEMIKASEPQVVHQETTIPSALQRKHSLGSCLADSENVLLQQTQQQQHNSSSNSSDEETTTLVKTEDEEDVFTKSDAADEETIIVEDLTERIDDLTLLEHPTPPSPTTPTTTTPTSSSPSSTSTLKRVKKKSLSGWLKELTKNPDPIENK